MQASPLPQLVLLISVALCGTAVAEYPFDPMMTPGPMNASPPGPYGDSVYGGSPYGGSAYGGPALGDPGYGYGGGAALNDGYGGDAYGGDVFGDSGYAGDGLDGYGPDDGYGYGSDALLDDGYAPAGQMFGFDNAIWPGFISGNLTPGTDRTLFGGEWFQPLYQDGRTLWYFDFRGQADDSSAREFNTGTGVRVIAEPGWIFGAYTFWDHLRSKYGNYYNQGMIGVEAMSVLWDVRFNVYFPESGAKYAGPPKAVVSNGNIVVSSGIERAYWGMDFEVGNLLWACGPNAQQELRGYLGLYHFDHSAPSTPSITGPRARVEYRYYDLPYFGPGSRFTVGLTAQVDEVRDGQLFAFARMRIPLDVWAHKRKPMSPLHRRMLDHIVRDVDIVTNTARRTERALNPITDREIRGFAQIDANTQNPGQVLDDLDTDSVILVDGRAGEIPIGSKLQLKSGQTVIGGGTPFYVRGAETGRKANFSSPATRPTLDFSHDHSIGQLYTPTPGNSAQNQSHVPGIWMNDLTQLIGVDIQHAKTGVNVENAEDVLISDVSITDYSDAGLYINQSEYVIVDKVRVRDAWLDAALTPTTNPILGGPVQSVGHVYIDTVSPHEEPRGVGMFVRDSRGVTIENSEIEDTNAEGIRVGWSADVTIRDSSIRDTPEKAIRVLDSENVIIENVTLKNTGDD